MDDLLRFSKKVAMRVCLYPLRVFPIKKNRVVLMNNLAKTYAGNPKYVAEYLIENYKDKFEIIFPVDDVNKHQFLAEKGIKTVKFNSLKYFYYTMTAKIYLTNSGGFSYVPLRKKQYVINTWHGGGAYKKCGLDMYVDTKIFRRDLAMSAKQTNLFLSTCKTFTEVFSKSMLINKDVFWEIGMPRNDIMLKDHTEIRDKVRKEIGLAEDERLVLFAPTYRKPNDNFFRQSIAISYGVDVERVCSALEKRFGGKWKFAFRYHPTVVNKESFSLSNALNLTDYPDIQELLCAADVMINDFSSSMWDFMLSGKPSFLFAIDLEHFVKTAEVYTPVEGWPFPKAVNNDELEKNILEFDEQSYKTECERYYNELGGTESGEATRLTCEKIAEVCFKK